MAEQAVMGAVHVAGEVARGFYHEVWVPMPWQGRTIIVVLGVAHLLSHLKRYEGVDPHFKSEIDRMGNDDSRREAYRKAMHAAEKYGEYGKLERLFKDGGVPSDKARGVAKAIADHHKVQREGNKG